MVLAAFCWGLSAVIAKGAFDRGISPEQMAQARVVVAGAPLLAYLALRRPALLSATRRALPMIALFGIAMVIVNWSYYVAIDRLDVGVAIALQYTAPVLILVLSAIVARRSPGRVAWFAGLLTLAGAVLVSGAYAGLDTIDSVGLLAGIAASLSFAGYLLSAEAAGRRGIHPATVLLIGFGVATVVWGVLQPWWLWPYARLADPQIVLRVVAVGLIGTLLPFMLAVAAVRVISASVAGIAATFEPVFAAALAWILLGQQLAAAQLIGGVFVVAGVVIAQLARPPDRATPVEVTP